MNYSLQELKDKICKEVNLFRDIEESKEELILSMQDGKTKKDVLTYLSNEDIDIKEFKIYIPSLEEIFVSKVGDR